MNDSMRQAVSPPATVEELSRELAQAFPNICLHYDPEKDKWFPLKGLRGTRFIGHSGITAAEAVRILSRRPPLTERDILLERY